MEKAVLIHPETAASSCTWFSFVEVRVICFLTQNTVSPRQDKIRFSPTTYISDTLVLLLNVFAVTPFPLLSYRTVSSLSCYVDSVLSPRVLHLLGRARPVTHDTSANMDWK